MKSAHTEKRSDKKTRVVLDCNILIAACIKDGACRKALFHAYDNFEVIITPQIMDEFDDVICRPKFAAYAASSQQIMVFVSMNSTTYPDIPMEDCELPDPDDEIYLHAALNSGAKYIVTGNGADFPTLSCDPVVILKASQFLEVYT